MTTRDHRPDIRFEGGGLPAAGAARPGRPREAGYTKGYGWATRRATFGLCLGYLWATGIAYLTVFLLANMHALFTEQISRIKDLPCLSPRPAKRRGRRHFRPGPNLAQSSPARQAAGPVPGPWLATGGRGGLARSGTRGL